MRAPIPSSGKALCCTPVIAAPRELFTAKVGCEINGTVSSSTPSCQLMRIRNDSVPDRDSRASTSLAHLKPCLMMRRELNSDLPTLLPYVCGRTPPSPPLLLPALSHPEYPCTSPSPDGPASPSGFDDAVRWLVERNFEWLNFSVWRLLYDLYTSKRSFSRVYFACVVDGRTSSLAA